jgi:hypothetical protein
VKEPLVFPALYVFSATDAEQKVLTFYEHLDYIQTLPAEKVRSLKLQRAKEIEGLYSFEFYHMKQCVEHSKNSPNTKY